MEVFSVLILVIFVTGVPFVAGMVAGTAMGTTGAILTFICCLGFQMFIGHLFNSN